MYHQYLDKKKCRGDTSAFGIKFTKSTTDTKAPILNFSSVGIGRYVFDEHDTKSPYNAFKKIKSIKRDAYSSPRGIPNPDAVSATIKDVAAEIKKMKRYDIKMFRFLDGDFARFTGIGADGKAITLSDSQHYVADVIAISQFALIELLVKKLTLDHGLNQWFTPIIRYADGFLDNLEIAGQKVEKKVSKLIYVRLRKVEENNEESTIFAFNADTYGFVADFSQDAHRLAMGNLHRTTKKGASEAAPDIFSEIFMSISFPQPVLKENADAFSVLALTKSMAAKSTGGLNNYIKSQKQIYDDFLIKFTEDYVPDNTLKNDDIGKFYETLVRNSSDYAVFMQRLLSLDDKLISFIRGVPASYMRADIYTGSKFNTVQYDSLAITRLIQLLASSMAGFPSTNNPQTNTEKGKIDSYPIFAANRMVIRPRVYFGVRDSKYEDDPSDNFYKLYTSLTELFVKEGYVDQGMATCFLILDVGQKQLKSEGDKPDFIFPMEDIRDFGMIKASTVNHSFNFSIKGQMNDFVLFKESTRAPNERTTIYKNAIENGIFIQYVEGGISSFGFSPPEHQHLKLEDLTQNREYTSWKNRAEPSSNIRFTEKGRPVYNPKKLYVDRTKNQVAKKYIVNDYDNWTKPKTIEIKQVESVSSTGTVTTGTLTFEETNAFVQINYPSITTRPFFGITSFINISDIKAEFKALQLIMNDPTIDYRDISNVDQKLMDNIKIRVPLTFTYNKKKGTKYENRIKFKGIAGGSKVSDGESLSVIIENINDELDKIDITEMMWLFPYTGFHINDLGELIEVGLDSGFATDQVWRKHLLLITYLDLLVKGIRYILWSLAKARFFAHVYLPIEYKKYAKTPPDGIDYATDIVEPGSSVRITYNKDNSLFKTVDAPGVAFPIKGLEQGERAYLPLYRSVSQGTDLVEVGETKRLENISKSERKMTWYVSKKVTYLGADGAMMRVEMTEGSLDWTLFYNEKNLLTQVSEHYLLNGLGNFRSGVF